MKKIAIVIAAMAVLGAHSADARVYNWTSSLLLADYSGSVTGSGVVVAADTISTSYDGITTGYLVQSFNGHYGGQQIIALLPVGYLGNDNLINTSVGAALDSFGLGFATDDHISGYTQICCIKVVYAGVYNTFQDNGPTSPTSNGFTLTAVDAPEPTSLILLATAFAGLCAARSRRS